MVKSKQWVLVASPKGPLTPENFAKREVELPELRDGDVLFRNLIVSCDPAQRTWLTSSSYVAKVMPGQVMPALTLCQVERSLHPAWKEGELATALGGWQERFVHNFNKAKEESAQPKDKKQSTWEKQQARNAALMNRISKVDPQLTKLNVPHETMLAALGMTGLTAYFGLLSVGRLKAGDVVLVSGAAGATGSVVGQVAKARGASRVIGIAGGAEKCKWLTDVAGFDAAIDYKRTDISLVQQLKRAAPDGIDIYFDNVGGDTLEAALACLKPLGRVVLCGAVSQYDKKAEEVRGIRNLGELVTKGGRMEGFLIMQYGPQFKEATKELADMHAQGKLRSAEDVMHGFDNIPHALIRLLNGKNLGKQLCKL